MKTAQALKRKTSQAFVKHNDVALGKIFPFHKFYL